MTDPVRAALLPCPFCGYSAPRLAVDPSCFAGQVYPSETGNEGFKFRCDSCGCQTCWWHSERQAIEGWNTRATPPREEIAGEAAASVADANWTEKRRHLDWTKHEGIADRPPPTTALDSGGVELHDLPLTWKCRARAYTLMRDNSSAPDDLTLGHIEALEDCEKELRAALAAPKPDRAVARKTIERCLTVIDRWISDITKAGDQFDKGGDIYSHANVLQGLRESIRALSHTALHEGGK